MQHEIPLCPKTKPVYSGDHESKVLSFYCCHVTSVFYPTMFYNLWAVVYSSNFITTIIKNGKIITNSDIRNCTDILKNREKCM